MKSEARVERAIDDIVDQLVNTPPSPERVLAGAILSTLYWVSGRRMIPVELRVSQILQRRAKEATKMGFSSASKLDTELALALGWGRPALPDYWPGVGFKRGGWTLIATAGGGMEWFPPALSTSGEQMLAVLNQMKELGWIASMGQGFKDEGWIAFFEKGKAFSGVAQELPHAVALAALAAVEGEGK
jgi:hypothetical protein